MSSRSRSNSISSYGAALAGVALAAFTMSSSATAQVLPGVRTDTFGNTITSSQVSSHIPSRLFRDISSLPLLTSGDQEETGIIPLGFLFPFYGKTYAGFNFTTDGVISSTAGGGEAFDWSNDASLPSTLITGGGARIYPHHDDTVARVYGAYFSAASSGFGTEAFIAQWKACYWLCDAGQDKDIVIEYNVALLRDGTIIMAHKFASSDNGGGATVGIQNETASDGVAYSANSTGSIVDGMTVLVIPAKSGISDDIQIAATEAAIVTTSAFAGNVHSHAGQAAHRKKSGSKRNLWGSVIGGRADGEIGSDLDLKNYGIQFGADLLKFGDVIVGLSASYQKADVTLGHVGLVTKSGSIAPYAGVRFGNLTATATVGYAHVDYESFDLVFLRDIHTDTGRRLFGSASVTGRYNWGSLALLPNLTASGVIEKIDQWHAGEISRDVENARFFKVSATAKAKLPVMAGAHAYVLGGVQFIKTDGDDTIALYAIDYDPTRTGGVLGAGFEIKSGAFNLSADVGAYGLGSDITSLDGRLRASVKF